MLAVRQLIRHLTPPAGNVMAIPLQLPINIQQNKYHQSWQVLASG